MACSKRRIPGIGWVTVSQRVPGSVTLRREARRHAASDWGPGEGEGEGWSADDWAAAFNPAGEAMDKAEAAARLTVALAHGRGFHEAMTGQPCEAEVVGAWAALTEDHLGSYEAGKLFRRFYRAGYDDGLHYRGKR